MKYVKITTILTQMDAALLALIKGLVLYTLSTVISCNFTKCNPLSRLVFISYPFIAYIYSSLRHLY
jgi:hypothetical protein